MSLILRCSVGMTRATAWCPSRERVGGAGGNWWRNLEPAERWFMAARLDSSEDVLQPCRVCLDNPVGQKFRRSMFFPSFFGLYIRPSLKTWKCDAGSQLLFTSVFKIILWFCSSCGVVFVSHGMRLRSILHSGRTHRMTSFSLSTFAYVTVRSILFGGVSNSPSFVLYFTYLSAGNRRSWIYNNDSSNEIRYYLFKYWQPSFHLKSRLWHSLIMKIRLRICSFSAKKKKNNNTWSDSFIWIIFEHRRGIDINVGEASRCKVENIISRQWRRSAVYRWKNYKNILFVSWS